MPQPSCRGSLSGMRIPKFKPYVEPVRRSWTRAELEATVRAVRAMAAAEAAGRDPRRLERQRALAAELGRDPKTVRPRLANVVHVLAQASLPVPTCLRPLGGVGTRTTATILDVWHSLDAEEDLAASGQTSARRPWTAAELSEALDVCRRMAALEATLGRPLDEDEAGDAVSEAACQLGRRWSEARRVMAAVAGLEDGPGPRCLQDVDPAVLEDAEATALERLRRGEKKEG